MHFGFTLKLSDIDLWNIDLLDTYLDLLDTGIPSTYFVSIMSSRHLQDQQMFAGKVLPLLLVFLFNLGVLDFVLKMCSIFHNNLPFKV